MTSNNEEEIEISQNILAPKVTSFVQFYFRRENERQKHRQQNSIINQQLKKLEQELKKAKEQARTKVTQYQKAHKSIEEKLRLIDIQKEIIGEEIQNQQEELNILKNMVHEQENSRKEVEKQIRKENDEFSQFLSDNQFSFKEVLTKKLQFEKQYLFMKENYNYIRSLMEENQKLKKQIQKNKSISSSNELTYENMKTEWIQNNFKGESSLWEESQQRIKKTLMTLSSTLNNIRQTSSLLYYLHDTKESIQIEDEKEVIQEQFFSMYEQKLKVRADQLTKVMDNELILIENKIKEGKVYLKSLGQEIKEMNQRIKQSDKKMNQKQIYIQKLQQVNMKFSDQQ